MSKDTKMEVGTIMVTVSPFGMCDYASQYLAAGIDCKTEKLFSPVPYFLVCHSIELLLKAFILATRVKQPPHLIGPILEWLKKDVGHNLKRVLAEAKADGVTGLVSIGPDDEAELLKANSYYNDKVFEYFYVFKAATGYQDLPDLERLKQLASCLLPKIDELCKNC
jgi:hypothetical protein